MPRDSKGSAVRGRRRGRAALCTGGARL